MASKTINENARATKTNNILTKAQGDALKKLYGGEDFDLDDINAEEMLKKVNKDLKISIMLMSIQYLTYFLLIFT